MSEYEQGTTVQFKGGLGRGDDPSTIHTGIVNGPTYFEGGDAFVPVHVREINHNLVVASTNIVKGRRMSEYESLRHEIIACAKAIDGYSDTAVRHLLEQSTQIDRLWADNAELRDEINAVANRLENLTFAVTTSPAEVAAAIVNDANRGTLREVRDDDAS